MTDLAQSYTESRRRHALRNSNYGQMLALKYPDADVDYALENNVPPSQMQAEADQKAAMAENATLTEQKLYSDTPEGADFSSAARLVYDQLYKKFERQGSYQVMGQPVSNRITDLMSSIEFKRPETDEEYARFGVELMGQFNYNVTKMGVDVARLQNIDDNTALAFYTMMNYYDNLPNFTWSGTKRMTKGILTDPTTLAGLTTLGLGPIGRAGIKQTTKKNFKNYLLQKVRQNAALGAVEGAGYGAVDNYLRQQVGIQAGVRDDVSGSEVIGAAGTGATAGAALGGLIPAATTRRSEFDALEVVDPPPPAPQPAMTLYSNPLEPLVGEALKKALALFDRPKNQASRIREIAVARKPIADGEEPKILTEDLHKYFDEIALQKYGRKLNITENPADFDLVKKELINDLAIQTRQEVSGKGWYDDDVFKSLVLLARIPGFEDLQTNETRRVILSAVLGATSPGPKVAQNTRSGAAQYLQWSKTGKFSTEAPPPNTAVAGIERAGFGQYGYPRGLEMVQFLIDKFGEEGFADFMLSPHTKKELTDLRLEAGFTSGPTGMSGKADSMHFGAAILGDKAGKFMLNINGYPTTTKDKWFVRSIRRFEGTFGDNLVKNKQGKMAELGQPRNKTERLAMDRLVLDVINSPELANLNLTEQDAQALLWFREQNLYNDLGVRTSPQTFSQGVENVGGQEGFGIRGSDEIKTALEQGTAELPDFRSVSGGQRAIRADRRRQLAQLNNPGSDAGSPGPYRKDSAEDAGRTGRLEADEQARSRYEAAGLRIPTIEVQDSAGSQQYATDIAAAMAEHEFGAQVEIKSADDLSSYTMYRTEDGGGFSIKPDGDIVAVFQPPGAAKGGIYAVLQAAIAQGGKKLDAFNTMLPRIYETVGFRPVARVKWNDKYAPKPPFAAKVWDKEVFAEFNNGEPDVVLFVYDENYFGGESINDLPIFDDFDEAAAVQDQALKDLQGN